MSSAPPPPTRAELAPEDRERHLLMTPLTRMRLRTQLLLRVARANDGPGWERMAAGLTAIDGDISTLIRQIERRDEGSGSPRRKTDSPGLP